MQCLGGVVRDTFVGLMGRKMEWVGEGVMTVAEFDAEYRQVFDEESGAVLNLIKGKIHERASHLETEMEGFRSKVVRTWKSLLVHTTVPEDHILLKLIHRYTTRATLTDTDKEIERILIPDPDLFQKEVGVHIGCLMILEAVLTDVRAELASVNELSTTMPNLFQNMNGQTNLMPFIPEMTSGRDYDRNYSREYDRRMFDSMAFCWRFESTYSPKLLPPSLQ